MGRFGFESWCATPRVGFSPRGGSRARGFARLGRDQLSMLRGQARALLVLIGQHEAPTLGRARRLGGLRNNGTPPFL